KFGGAIVAETPPMLLGHVTVNWKMYGGGGGPPSWFTCALHPAGGGTSTRHSLTLFRLNIAPTSNAPLHVGLVLVENPSCTWLAFFLSGPQSTSSGSWGSGRHGT